MTWPTVARAIFLLPAGFRAHDEDFTVALPPPRDLPDPVTAQPYTLVQLHHGGSVDAETRALYVLGGEYLPHGAQATPCHDPDEAHDQ